MWKRNSAIIAAGIVVCAAAIFKLSANYERRLRAGPIPVPSQRWATHTLQDDPSYPEKFAAYKKNKKTLGQRIFQNKDDFLEE